MATPSCVNPDACAEQRIDPLTCGFTHIASVTRSEVPEEGNFTGGTFLTNGHLLFADYFNKRLVEFDTSHKIVENYKIDGKPQDVTSLGDHIYVSVVKEKWYIQKCRVDEELSVVSQIKAPAYTWGLAVTDDEKIVVATLSAVHILSQSGNLEQTIQTSGGLYVAVLRQSPALFYHRDGDAVVCRTVKDGQEQFRYRNDDMVSPAGICVGDSGVLYVCCVGKQNVHQISPDGQFGKVLLDKLHGITTPRAVLYNPNTKEYVITSYKEETLVEIYKLR